MVHAGKLGIASLSIYPHQGEVALTEFSEISDHFRLAHQVGLRVKTGTSGISVKNTERLLHLVDKLAVSVSAMDCETYRIFRSRENYNGMCTTLELLKEYRQQRSELMLV